MHLEIDSCELQGDPRPRPRDSLNIRMKSLKCSQAAFDWLGTTVQTKSLVLGLPADAFFMSFKYARQVS